MFLDLFYELTQEWTTHTIPSLMLPFVFSFSLLDEILSFFNKEIEKVLESFVFLKCKFD
jgi:hypothetical protein